MQPFSLPHGDYYEKISKPAIEKIGLQAVRADAEIFDTGKIIDQVWRGINAAKPDFNTLFLQVSDFI
jgi:hypothetical protein